MINYEFKLTKKEIYDSKKYLFQYNWIDRILYLSFFPLIILFLADFIIDLNLLLFITIILLVTSLRILIRLRKIGKSVVKCNKADENTQIELKDNQIIIKVNNVKYKNHINNLVVFSIPNFHVIFDIKTYYFLIPKNEITGKLKVLINENKVFNLWKYIRLISFVLIFSIKIVFAFYNINNQYSGTNWMIEELTLRGNFFEDINYTQKDSVEAVLVKNEPFTLPLSTTAYRDKKKMAQINFRFEPINKIRILSIDVSSIYGYNYFAFPMMGLLDYKVEESCIIMEKCKKDSCRFKLVLKKKS